MFCYEKLHIDAEIWWGWSDNRCMENVGTGGWVELYMLWGLIIRKTELSIFSVGGLEGSASIFNWSLSLLNYVFPLLIAFYTTIDYMWKAGFFWHLVYTYSWILGFDCSSKIWFWSISFDVLRFLESNILSSPEKVLLLLFLSVFFFFPNYSSKLNQNKKSSSPWMFLL